MTTALNPKTQALLGAIAEADDEIVRLKNELKLLRQQREEMLADVVGLLPLTCPEETTVDTHKVTIRRARIVTFPLASKDPERHEALRQVMIRHDAWIPFSTLRYAKLKRSWFSQRDLTNRLRQDLRTFAAESLRVQIATKPMSPQTRR